MLVSALQIWMWNLPCSLYCNGRGRWGFDMTIDIQYCLLTPNVQFFCRDLHGNKLIGPIPMQIGNLSSLNFV